MTKPVAYQEIEGRKEYVEARYVLKGRSRYGFKIGRYNTDYPLVIDPLLASTFIGGGSYDYATAVAIDSSGDVYVAGYTSSAEYPTTAAAFDGSFNGERDVFLSKFDSKLTTLLASTFIGGVVMTEPTLF